MQKNFAASSGFLGNAKRKLNCANFPNFRFGRFCCTKTLTRCAQTVLKNCHCSASANFSVSIIAYFRSPPLVAAVLLMNDNDLKIINKYG